MLHHVEINVSDLNKSLSFWQWLLENLGYKEYQSWDQGKSWKLNDCYIVFVQTEEKHKNVVYHRCKTGLNHLAFHARSREHVDQITEECRRRNITILYKDRHPYAGKEAYAVYFEDPDRIKIELVAPQ